MIHPMHSSLEAYRLVDEGDRRVSVLANGMTVVVQRHEVAPVAAVRVYVRGGSVFEGPYGGGGISHLLEHMVTGDAAAGSSEQALLELADSIGGLVNAYTACDHICYHANVSCEHLATVVKLLADWVVRPALSREVFARELGVVQRELERDRDDPETQLEELLHELVYRGHPLRHPVIGHPAGLGRLTHEDLVGHHGRVHSPENITVAIAGDVLLDESVGVVQAAFAGLERRPGAGIELPEPRRLIGPLRAIKRMAVESTSLLMAWPTVREVEADDVALDLLSSVLLDGDSARLVAELRWRRSLVYGISGTHDSSWHTRGTFQIAAQLDATKLDAVERAVLDVIERLEKEPITEAELATAKRLNVVAVRMQRQTAEGLATQLGEDFLASGDVNYSDVYVARIESATVDDLMRVARRHLFPQGRVLVAVVPEQAKAAATRSMRRGGVAATDRAELGNGLTCLTRQMWGTEFVAISTCFAGGLRCETAETNGLFNLMTESMLRGTTSQSGEAIAELFASRGSTLMAGSGADAFGFDCVAPAEDAEALFEALAEVAASPAFDPSEVDKVKPAIRDAIARIDEDWRSDLIRFARGRFFRYSPYRFVRLGSRDNIERFDAEMLRDVHGRFACGRRGVVSVAGDIEPDHAADWTRRFFGELPRGKDWAGVAVADEPPPTRDRLFVKRAADGREAAGIFIGFPGYRVTDREIRGALTVMGTMLVGYGLSGGRLYTALRSGDRDLVYEVSGAGFAGVLPGYLAVIAACVPSRVNEVHGIIREQIDAVKAGRFDDDELDRARNMVVTGELDQMQAPIDFARRTAYDELVGLDRDDWRTLLDEVRDVSREDIVQVAERLLDHATIAVVTAQPECVDLGIEATGDL